MDGSFVILFRDESREEIFLVFRSDYPIWVLMGGGIEKGEKPEETAIRESFEETGFKIKLLRQLGIYEVLNKKNELVRKTHFYEGKVVSGKFRPEFPNCRGEWFNIHHLPKDLTHRTKEKINDAINFEGKQFVKKIYREPIRANLHLMFRHPIGAGKYISDKYLK